MVTNIFESYSLSGLARAKVKTSLTKTVRRSKIDNFVSEGWSIEKENEESIRIIKNKDHTNIFKDRVWSLYYKMGFTYLSGDDSVSFIPKLSDGFKNTIDLVAIDDEVVVATEIRSRENYGKDAKFDQLLKSFALIKEKFIRDIKSQYPSDLKKQFAFSFFISNITLTDNERATAKQNSIILFDNNDLLYYENLISHIGKAAKYQFLADLLPGKRVSGLHIKIPAIKAKMGGSNCYTFSISPEYLLKIAYVAHRSKGKLSDVSTYQRMMNKSKLKNIRSYINNAGIFPTNIILNLEKSKVSFQKIKQESIVNDDLDSGILGWLDITPTYKSAWIIDGQHRLFAYSDSEFSKDGKLSVLAFEGLTPSKQAELFIDINAKQKRVSQSLLQEIYAELHWDSDKYEDKVAAIVSKLIQDLGKDPESKLFQRIQTNDIKKDSKRCISLTSIYSEIEKSKFHIAKEKNGEVTEFGPLWAGDNNLTLKRTSYIIKNWLLIVTDPVKDWWDKGSADGGGLAMNDGVVTCIKLLKSVFDHLEKDNIKLIQKDNASLLKMIKPYGDILGEYLKSFNDDSRKRFRDLRGIQGITSRTRKCQLALRDKFPSFNPLGLEEFLREEKLQTRETAKKLLDEIEEILQAFIIEELKTEFGPTDNEWWALGVPKNIRTKVSQLWEEDDRKRGGIEHYLNLIHYREIIENNWILFQNILGYGKGNISKQKKTEWLHFINEQRKIIAHASSGRQVKVDDLNQIELYHSWLNEQINPINNDDDES